MIAAFFQTLKIMSIIEQEKGFWRTYGKLLLQMYLRYAPVYYLIFLFGWLIGPFLGGGSCWTAYEN
jgi:hypothetical protein